MTKVAPNIQNPYGYIYRTTNLVNGKKYIGKHSKSEFDFSYYGSGVLLVKALQKYGKDNFIVEPIDWVESKEELNRKEMLWIEKCNAVKSEDYYNISIGGDGCGSGKDNPCFGTHINAGKSNGMYGDHRFAGDNHLMKNKRHSDESRAKISKRSRGVNNPMCIPVVQLSLTGEFIRKFQYIQQAADILGFTSSSAHADISYCCKGKKSSYKRFKWMFLQDYLKQGGETIVK